MKLVFLFRLDLILHACKIPLRCDSFRILNFATKQEDIRAIPCLLLGLATRHLKHKVAQLVSHKFPYIPISIFSNSASKSTDDQGARRPRSAREESSPRLPWKKTTCGRNSATILVRFSSTLKRTGKNGWPVNNIWLHGPRRRSWRRNSSGGGMMCQVMTIHKWISRRLRRLLRS